MVINCGTVTNRADHEMFLIFFFGLRAEIHIFGVDIIW